MKDDYYEGKSIKKTIIIVLLLIILIAISFFGWGRYRDYRAKKLYEEMTATLAPVSEYDTRPENPVDFDALWQDNDEIYAWISIPNTGIELPILQSRSDDRYYLNRDIYGNYSRLGSIFSQSKNLRDFLDPVTVIYGHNYMTGGMFTNLHYFEDKDFFDKNEFFYIYTPDRKLTYSIVSAYKYDNRHILNSFNFSDPEVLQEYFDYVVNPQSMLKNVREEAALELDDKLVVLSTCLTNGYSGRYLVNGVLIKDEQTR